MRPVRWRPGWREFFGADPYPVDLGLVEARDATAAPLGRLLLRELGPGSQRVLDLGCGHGRHLPALAAAGHRPFGLDAAESAVRQARRCAPTSTVIVGDCCRSPFRAASFDAALSLYSSLAYDTGLLPPLREAARVVREGGLLVVDTVNRPQRLDIGCERTRDGSALRASLSLRGRRRQCNVAFRPSAVEFFSLAVAVPARDQLVAALGRTGWRVRAVFGDHDGSAHGRWSPRTVVVACRVGA